MIPDTLIKRQVYPLLNAPLTGAAPLTINGNAVNMNGVKVCSLAAYVRLRLTTTSLAVTAKWQVKDKTNTWIDVTNGPQNPAAVALQTGTGGAIVAARAIPAPDVHGFSQIRCVLTTSGAVGGGAGVDDVQELSYCYIDPFDGF